MKQAITSIHLFLQAFKPKFYRPSNFDFFFYVHSALELVDKKQVIENQPQILLQLRLYFSKTSESNHNNSLHLRPSRPKFYKPSNFEFFHSVVTGVTLLYSSGLQKSSIILGSTEWRDLEFKVIIHNSASEISSGSLDIHFQKKWSLTSLPKEWK